MQYTISENNLHIQDSFLIRTRDEMLITLSLAEHDNPGSLVWKRTTGSLIREWRGHNLLYDLHLFRSHTKDVDLQYPSTLWMDICYAILSFFCWGH